MRLTSSPNPYRPNKPSLASSQQAKVSKKSAKKNPMASVNKMSEMVTEAVIGSIEKGYVSQGKGVAILEKFMAKFARYNRAGLTKKEHAKLQKEVIQLFAKISKSANPDKLMPSKLSTQEKQMIHQFSLHSYGDVVVNDTNRRYEVSERRAIQSYFATLKGIIPDGEIKKPTNSSSTNLHKLKGEARAQLSKFQSYVLNHWNEFDQDNNGVIGFHEARETLADHSVKGKEQDYRFFLANQFGTLASIYDNNGIDGISKKEIQSLSKPGSFGKASFKNRNQIYRAANYYLAGKSSFVDSKVSESAQNLFDGVPDPMSISQGMIGDCWLISFMAGMTPQDIQETVKPISADQAEVHLAGYKPIVVDRPTKMQELIGVKSNGYWGYAIQEAVRDVRPTDGPITSDPLNGGWQTEASNYIYGVGGESCQFGHDFSSGDVAYMKEFYQNDITLNNARKPKEVMDFLVKNSDKQLFAASELLGSDDQDLPNGVVSTHAYTVMGFDPKEGTVTIRNPWRKDSLDKEGENDGIYTLSIEEFTASYCMVSAIDKNQVA